MRKPHPERVIPQILKRAVETGKPRNMHFSEYIRFMYKATGSLVPRCDAIDFYAALDEYLSRLEATNEDNDENFL